VHVVTRHRILGLAIGMLLAIPTPAYAAPGYGYAKAQQAPAGTQGARDDAEQRGHVIPGEDASPRREDRTPAPAPAPSAPPVSASPVQVVSPAPTVAREELPRTGGDDALLLLWFGALVVGAGLCMRRAIA
jgi:LPXTG-motif cell wall-anchored protein